MFQTLSWDSWIKYSPFLIYATVRFQPEIPSATGKEGFFPTGSSRADRECWSHAPILCYFWVMSVMPGWRDGYNYGTGMGTEIFDTRNSSGWEHHGTANLSSSVYSSFLKNSGILCPYLWCLHLGHLQDIIKYHRKTVVSNYGKSRKGLIKMVEWIPLGAQDYLKSCSLSLKLHG